MEWNKTPLHSHVMFKEVIYTGFDLIKKPISRKPPSGAPEGTVWFGGPVDRWKVALCVHGEELDPDRISALLGCEPTSAARRGNPFPRKGRWILRVESKKCGESDDVEDGIRILLARLPSDGDVWVSLTGTYSVRVSCGLFLAASNRGFAISADVSKLLSDRNLEISFNVYFDRDLADAEAPKS